MFLNIQPIILLSNIKELLEFYKNNNDKIFILCNSNLSLTQHIIDFFEIHSCKIEVIKNLYMIKQDESSKIFMSNIDINHSFYVNNCYFISIKKIISNASFYSVIYQKNKNENNQCSEIERIMKELHNFKQGDFIIHKKFGLGKFISIEILNISSVLHECVKIEYANNEKLFIPIENISQISKYKSSSDLSSEDLTLDMLGSDSWVKKKQKARSKIQELAHKILEMNAKRTLLEGAKFDIEKQRNIINKFYESFQHQDTEDQSKATIDIEIDLSSSKPMNRLICGDVGFGKTEIALRASFIVCVNNFKT